MDSLWIDMKSGQYTTYIGGLVYCNSKSGKLFFHNWRGHSLGPASQGHIFSLQVQFFFNWSSRKKDYQCSK